MPARDTTIDAREPLALPPVPPPAPATYVWRDRFLAALFALALAAPGLALFANIDRTTLEFENRVAAPWPGRSTPGGLSNIVGAFERAFADRFGARDLLIQMHHTALAVIFGTSPVANVIIGRDGWLFFKGEGNGVAFDRDFRRSLPPSVPEIAAIADGIARRVQFLARSGIDYLLVIVPDKYTIYPEHVPLALQPLSDRSPLDALLALLPAEVLAHVLDLRPALLAAKGERQLYFSTDTHWNANGAWIGYRQIRSALRKDAGGGSPEPLPPESLNGQISGDLAHMIGAPTYFSSPRPTLTGGLGTPICARTDDGAPPVWGAPRQILHCPSAPLGKAAIFNDSMGIPLVHLLSSEFRESRWAEGRVWNARELVAWSPTIVIDEIVERNLALLGDASFLGPVPTAPSALREWSRGRPPGAPEATRETLSCALDQVNGSPVTGAFEIRARDTLGIDGWAADAGSGTLPQSAWVVLRDGDTIMHVAAELGRSRPDVATATGNASLATAGYRVRAATGGIPAGSYAVSMTWIDRNGWMSCDLRRTLKMRAD